MDRLNRRNTGSEAFLSLMVGTGATPACTRDNVAEIQDRYFVTRDPRLRSDLVCYHAGLAERLASSLSRRGESTDDLIQVAFIGLIHAVDRYDPRAGVAFASYAVPTILGELKRHFRDRAWSMRVPRRLQELYMEAKGIVDLLTQETGRSPTFGEIAARMGAREEDVVEALEAGRNFYALSLDAPRVESDGRVDLTPGVNDPGLVSIENRRFLLALADGLPERARLVIQLRFDKGMTQSQIARQVGVSQMHVSRLLTKSLEYMRRRAVQSSREAS
jgi:RNA polymerase sigma-B factor